MSTLFTPLFRIAMALILVVITVLLAFVGAWAGVVVVGACAIFCVINIYKEISDVSVSSETEE